jgi:molecular chaperone DnaJ
MTRTYYEILGVSEDATRDAIDSAYRERVKETHPDLNDEADAADQFRDVVRAEKVLGNEAERARYDDLGHDAYVTQVDGTNAAGTERSPWTADRSKGKETSKSSASTATNYSGDWGTETDTAETSSTAAGKQRSRTSAKEKRSTHRAGRHVRETVDTESTADGYAVHDWDEGSVDEPEYQFRLTQERAFLSLLVFVLYPVFVYSSLSPEFTLMTNLIVGICTLLVLAYLLTIPEIGLLVFGSWSIIAPFIVMVFPAFDLFSPIGLIAIVTTWVPLGYSIAFARVTRA